MTLSACPACNSEDVHFKLSVKDFSISGEIFEVWECSKCSLRFTQNAPSEENIGPYYQSENYISHSNTNKGLVNKLYHSVKKITLNKKKKIIKNATGFSTGKILDVGAGTGAFLNTMRQGGWQVSGIEPDVIARKNASDLYRLNLLDQEALKSFTPASFDVITMWHVLEHVHQLNETIALLMNLLKPNGKLIIAVPNYTSFDAHYYKEFWAAYDVPRHLYHFSPDAMKKLLVDHGMNNPVLLPMWFDSFYVSMLSEKYKYGKSRLVQAFFTGLKSNLKARNKIENCSSVIYISAIKP
ncbi:MAG: class I SAM-dependent methyltransferase [Bacteroidetes bacterium]|nr:class I SAM-dependent methyltransferase [Bacteroidota bacterium]